MRRRDFIQLVACGAAGSLIVPRSSAGGASPMTIIDSQVHAYEANTPKRPWHSVPNWPVCMDRPRVASRKVMIWRSWSCASVSGLLMEPLSSWPSWISARARSHSRLGPEGHTGHLIANALAKPFSISSFRLADLGGKANSTIVLGASLSVSHSPGECFRLPPS